MGNIRHLLLSFTLVIHVAFVYDLNIKKINLNLDKDEITFIFLDLFDGEALLVKNWQGETALINTGSSEARTELKKRLSLFDIDSIDYLILTGSDEKRAGNAKWLTHEYSVKHLYTTPSIQKNLQLPVLFHPLTLFEGNKIMSGLFIKVLYVPDENKSITLSIHYGKNKLLFMGYTTKKVEKDLVLDPDLKADILKVGEFGNSQSTSQMFLDHVDPDVAVLFKQKGKRPSDEVMERLQESWISIYQTYRFGLIMIKCDKNFYDIAKIRIE